MILRLRAMLHVQSGYETTCALVADETVLDWKQGMEHVEQMGISTSSTRRVDSAGQARMDIH
jgi:hypothetical protein